MIVSVWHGHKCLTKDLVKRSAPLLCVDMTIKRSRCLSNQLSMMNPRSHTFRFPLCILCVQCAYFPSLFCSLMHCLLVVTTADTLIPYGIEKMVYHFVLVHACDTIFHTMGRRFLQWASTLCFHVWEAWHIEQHIAFFNEMKKACKLTFDQSSKPATTEIENWNTSQWTIIIRTNHNS